MSGKRVFVESLTHKVTAEETGWEDTDQGTDDDTDDEVILSDEEQEDGNEVGDSKTVFGRITSEPALISLLTAQLNANGPAAALPKAAPHSAQVLCSDCTQKNMRSPHFAQVLCSGCTRKKMRSNELDKTTQKSLFLDRQSKRLTFNAIKRRHTTDDIGKSLSKNKNACIYLLQENDCHKAW